jgi:hypothetical protein
MILSLVSNSGKRTKSPVNHMCCTVYPITKSGFTTTPACIPEDQQHTISSTCDAPIEKSIRSGYLDHSVIDVCLRSYWHWLLLFRPAIVGIGQLSFQI